MKKIIIGVAIFAVAIAAIYVTQQKPVEYEAVETITATTTEQVQLDNVSEAQKQINEANRLLNDEEQALLAEKANIENKLEEIRKVRLSFSQAPKQAE